MADLNGDLRFILIDSYSERSSGRQNGNLRFILIDSTPPRSSGRSIPLKMVI